MDLVAYYIENQMLAASFYAAAALLFYRWMLFILIFFRFSFSSNQPGAMGLFTVAPRILIPLHRLILQRPFYTIGRMLFHILILATPIGLSQHIQLWQDTGFYWELFWIPDEWVDVLTVMVFISIAYLFVRRILFARERSASGAVNYLLLGLTALPFLTGYLTANVSLDLIPWANNYMVTLHVLSGEIFIVAIGLLICRVKLQPDGCTGCAACALNCPAKALETADTMESRRIVYSQTQCIYCGNCVAICPDHACSLQHAFSIINPLNLRRSRLLNEVELSECRQCGLKYASKEQLSKLAGEMKDNSIELCPDCRKKNQSQKIYQEMFSQ